ncbi:hypothetical protein AbraIFM66950_010086 [Aspergillus brasiliensis]|nr:hypothetical protein AbraIFM66950_010086 [Aspergillus brasiliensis]
MKMADFVCPSDTFQACPPHLRTTFSQEDRFRFTPVKATRTAPRPWERKPSTAFRARGKSRKVWKRFRTSFNSMKALQQLIAAERHTVDDDLHLEINTSRNPGLRRGVKRRCFALEADALEEGLRGRSFLETQWESEANGRRRKLPLIYSDFVDIPDEPVEYDSLQLDESCDDLKNDQEMPTSTLEEELENPADTDECPNPIPETPTKLASDAAYSSSLHGQSPLVVGGIVVGTPDLRTREDVEQPAVHLSDASEEEPTTPEDADHDDNTVSTLIGEVHTDEAPTVPVDGQSLEEAAAATVAAPVQELTTEQESTLVRSALRSSLGGEDTELLNNFLSKAKAKREAKAAAMAAPEPEKSEAEVSVVVASPTPPARRALEDLDTNSPSPQKPQPSPTKEKDEASPQPSSPRRSTRPRTARSSNLLTTITAAAAVRNTLSLRRAKGTEFVFLQRTEAQELALTTRRNTRLNKGNALAPKFVLQGLTRKSPESGKKAGTAPCTDGDTTGDLSERPHKTAKKHVSWNDEELVQFEDGSEAAAKGEEHDVASRGSKGKSPEKRKAASSRTTRSQMAQKSGGEDRADAAATAPATATPRTRRVRRLGPGAPKAVSNDSLSSPSSSSSESSENSASTAEQRKKLTPKSPRRVPATPSKPASDSIKTSLRSSSAKTNLLKINAGSTPVPRRMRPRA